MTNQHVIVLRMLDTSDLMDRVLMSPHRDTKEGISLLRDMEEYMAQLALHVQFPAVGRVDAVGVKHPAACTCADCLGMLYRA